MSKPFDTVILNALVVDGTGGPAREADVGIRGDRIELVGHFAAEAKHVIDAFGLVLSPGFVDLHSHSDYSLLADPLARSKVFQGVTTEVGGNCGYHAAPVFGQVAQERREEYARSLGLVCDWTTSAEYRRRLAEARPSLNYAQQIGYNTLRSAVTADHADELTRVERDKLKDLVREEYRQGAIGLSYGIAYTPACFARTEELVDAAEVSAESGGFISFHIRNEDAGILESLEEALAIGKLSGAPTHIGHLKTFRRPNWHKLNDALALLERHRREGLDLTCDRYPHLAMNTQLKFILPTWVLEGGVEAMKARLRRSDVRHRIREDWGESVYTEASEVLISLVANARNKHAEGRFLDDLPGDPVDQVCDILADEGDSAFATFFGMTRANLDRIIDLDYVVVASDSSIQAVHRQAGGGRPHPRCFDTFPYFLAEWVFARERVPLEKGIEKITRLPAQRAGLEGRGIIAEGYFADLVLLDPGALTQDVDYENSVRYPTGVVTVFVNGERVVDRGTHSGFRPGRLLTSVHCGT